MVEQEQKEVHVPFPGREDPLEEGVETHSSVLAWTILAQRSLVGCNL